MIKIDTGWVKLFEQQTWVFIALAFFAVALRYLVGVGELPFLAKFNWFQDAATVAAVLFAILAIGSIAQQLMGWARDSWSSKKYRTMVLSRLNSLSDIEHRTLSYLVQANEQSFDYRNDDGDVQQLVGKGLLYTPAGEYDIFRVPFLVPDFVWRELKRRKGEFSSAAPPGDKPWVKDWMAY